MLQEHVLAEMERLRRSLHVHRKTDRHTGRANLGRSLWFHLSCNLLFYNFCTKGNECQFGLLEALDAKRYPDDSTAKDNTVEKGLQGKGDTAENKPEYIGKDRGDTSSVHHFFAEGEKGQASHFEALKAYGDAYDADTP